MQPVLPWIIAVVSMSAVVGLLLSPWIQSLRRQRRRRLPKKWPLTPRPVFDNAERIVYRHLRDALPHSVVLAKLPLMRFCQPVDPQQVLYWVELLGAAHVSFAVCSPSGRVLLAVDLYSDRVSRRTVQIKASVLAACRVPHLYAAPGALPAATELRALVPTPTSSNPGGGAGAPQQPVDSGPGVLSASDDGQLPLWQDPATVTDKPLPFNPTLAGSRTGTVGGPGGAASGKSDTVRPTPPSDGGSGPR